MLRFKQCLYLLMAMVLVVGLVGCGNDDDDDDDNNDAPGNVSEEFPSVAIADVPPVVIQQAPEVAALQGFGAGIASWASFAAAGGTQTADGWVWESTDTATGQQVVIEATEVGGDTMQWTVSLGGVDLWVGEVSNDGENVRWQSFDATGQEVEATYTATTDADGNRMFELTMDEVVYEGTIRADGSGSVTMERNGTTTMETEWNADGTGSRTIYDENGNALFETTW